jgi:hypothetical protein
VRSIGCSSEPSTTQCSPPLERENSICRPRAARLLACGWRPAWESRLGAASAGSLFRSARVHSEW